MRFYGGTDCGGGEGGEGKEGGGEEAGTEEGGEAREHCGGVVGDFLDFFLGGRGVRMINE